MKKRILFCTHSIDNGGSAKSLYILLKYLPKEYIPAILSLRDPSPQSFYMKFYQEHKIPVFIFPFGWLPVSYINCPINIEAQKKRMVEMRPFLSQLRWLGAPASHICFNGYPSCSISPYFDAHIPQSLIAREQINSQQADIQIGGLLHRHVKKAIAIGPMEASQLLNMGIPHKIVFNSATQIPEYVPPRPCPPVNFAVFTRFGPDKGLDTLFKAVRIAKKQLSDNLVTIRIYGAHGQQNFGIEQEIAAFIRTHDLNNLIKIEDWVDDVNKAIIYAHCIIRPDKSGSPWGRDIIEAMSVGRPVIATGSLDVFIKNNHTGWLVPVDDPDALANQLIYISQNFPLLEKAGLEAFEFAKKNFNPIKNTLEISEYLFQ